MTIAALPEPLYLSYPLENMKTGRQQSQVSPLVVPNALRFVTAWFVAACLQIVFPFILNGDDKHLSAVCNGKLETSHLPNAIRITNKIISGGLPDGPEAFLELQHLGVKTIISVDGVKPDVELAKRYGMRYVHLPHGYDGISEERSLQIAKAVRDLPGPIYIHCHHGRHRSPVAAAVAGITLNWVTLEQATEILSVAGTNSQYRGLYEAVHNARPRPSYDLDAVASDFPEVAKLPQMAETMVAIEKTFHRLQLSEAANWSTVENHPDIDPSHEALLLQEHYAELMRTESIQRMPSGFIDLLKIGENEARSLQAELLVRAENNTDDDEVFSGRMTKINANCVACHRQFRDIPLSEKPQFAPHATTPADNPKP